MTPGKHGDFLGRTCKQVAHDVQEYARRDMGLPVDADVDPAALAAYMRMVADILSELGLTLSILAERNAKLAEGSH